MKIIDENEWSICFSRSLSTACVSSYPRFFVFRARAARGAGARRRAGAPGAPGRSPEAGGCRVFKLHLIDVHHNVATRPTRPSSDVDRTPPSRNLELRQSRPFSFPRWLLERARARPPLALLALSRERDDPYPYP